MNNRDASVTAHRAARSISDVYIYADMYVSAINRRIDDLSRSRK